MELILSKHCESLTGCLGRQFGYHIKHRNPQFFAVAWKRGWLSINEFERFKAYAMQ